MEIKIINTRMCTNYFCHLAIAEYGTLDPLTSWKDAQLAIYMASVIMGTLALKNGSNAPTHA